MTDRSPPGDTACVLAINAGSSSIRFALYDVPEPLRRRSRGKIERIGLPGTMFTVDDSTGARAQSRAIDALNHGAAASALIDWLDEVGLLSASQGRGTPRGPRHEALRTGTGHAEAARGTAPHHAVCPRSPAARDRADRGVSRRHPKLPQVACFDTAFHRTMPRVAKLLPIPRRYAAKGVERYGFHGLSYAYLMEELGRLDPAAAKGRVILAHLGNGASLAAVRDGKSIDTSMGFTPTAGLVMSTRSGDLDPGLVYYLARTERMTAAQFQQMVNHESGLLGVSGTSSDLRDLLAREGRDVRAARSRGAVLLPGEKVDRLLRRGARWIGHARLRRRHRRKRAAHPRSGSATDSVFSASSWTASAMRRSRADFDATPVASRCGSSAPTRNS